MASQNRKRTNRTPAKKATTARKAAPAQKGSPTRKAALVGKAAAVQAPRPAAGASVAVAAARAPASPRPTAATPPGAPDARRQRDWATIGIGAAVTLGAFVLYLLTAAHDLIAGDTPDFLIASKTLGVPHAPGYPLLTMLGHVFSWLPVGSIPFRIGLLAVVCSTATVAMVFATVWRFSELRSAAAGAALALAATPLFWRWSLQMETFPLNNLLAVVIAYLMVRWYQAPARRGFLIAAAFVFGLGLTNQLTIALVGPAIAWVLFLRRRSLERRPGTIGWAALALLAGLLPYVYIPLASLGHSPDNWDYVHSWSAFVRLVERKDYGGVTAQGGGSAGSGSNAIVRTGYLALAFGVVLGVTVVVGLVRAFLALPWYFWFCFLALLFTGVAFNIDTNLDPTNATSLFVLGRFFLLPMVLLAPLAGLGLDWMAEWVARAARSLSAEQAGAAVVGLVLAASAAVVGVSYSTLDVRDDHVTGNYARDVVESLKPHTILFVTGDEADLPTLYETTVANVRPDVTVVITPIFIAPWYRQELAHNHKVKLPAKMTTLGFIQANPGRPYAFIGNPPDKTIDGKYYFYPVGLVDQLVPEATNIAVTQEIADNQAQFKRLHVPDYRTIKPESFEHTILDLYANVPYTIGGALQRVGQDAQAIDWYRKTLAIAPHLPAAVKALKKLGVDAS